MRAMGRIRKKGMRRQMSEVEEAEAERRKGIRWRA